MAQSIKASISGRVLLQFSKLYFSHNQTSVALIVRLSDVAKRFAQNPLRAVVLPFSAASRSGCASKSYAEPRLPGYQIGSVLEFRMLIEAASAASVSRASVTPLAVC